jgi:hypothetical protein
VRLPPDQIERFFAIWKPLLLFVNRRLRVEPAMLHAKVNERWDPQKVFAIREALWANDDLRKSFIDKNPAKLSEADLAIVESWQHRVAGTFCVYRHLKQHSILIQDSPENVYGVLGLASTFDELVPFTPCYAQTVLLPFESRIIYDSLIAPYNVYLGPGIRQNLDDLYRDAKERGAIITSLLPPEKPANREEQQAAAHEVNGKVLDAFRRHLYAAGFSTKVAERDLATVAAFAEDYLAGLAEPLSLRDFGTNEVRHYRQQL